MGEQIENRRYINLPYQIVLQKATTIVEVGVCTAVNAIHMLEAAIRYNAQKPSDIKYFGFDLFEEGIEGIVDEDIPQKGVLSRPVPYQQVFEKLRLTGATINLIQGSTFETLPKFIEEHLGEQFDLIFIDAGHSFASVANDWKWSQKLMDNNTVVLFDDYFSGGHVEGEGEWGVSAVIDNIDRSKFKVSLLYPNDILSPPQDVTRYVYVPNEGMKMYSSIIKVRKNSRSKENEKN